MRLNHLDLPVPNVAEARDFFEQWLGFEHLSTRGADSLSVLRDESGFVLVLSALEPFGAQTLPQGFHLGFHLGSAAAVETLHAELAEAGYAGDPPRHQHGAFAFYFAAPGEVLIEVAHRPPG